MPVKLAGMTPMIITGSLSRTAVVPITAVSPPNTRRQSGSDSTATAPDADGIESAAAMVRPMRARAPSVENRLVVTSSARTRSADCAGAPAGSPVRRRLYSSQLEKPASAKAGTISRSRTYLLYVHGMESTAKKKPGVTVWAVTTNRSAAGNGSGRRRMTFTSVKTAAVAPMPNASDVMAMAVNAGAWRSDRSA